MKDYEFKFPAYSWLDEGTQIELKVSATLVPECSKSWDDPGNARTIMIMDIVEASTNQEIKNIAFFNKHEEELIDWAEFYLDKVVPQQAVVPDHVEY